MCWNKEVSMTTFIITIMAAVFLFIRNDNNDRWIAIFAATVGLMQLAEYFMWSDQTCGKINKYASIFALIVLLLEPLVNIGCGLYYSDSKVFFKYLLIAYIIFVCYIYTACVRNKEIKLCGTSMCDMPQGNSFFGRKLCNLKWFFLDNFRKNKASMLWIIFLLLPFLMVKPISQGLALAAIGIGTIMVAYATSSSAFGSLWCWLAILLVLYKIVAK